MPFHTQGILMPFHYCLIIWDDLGTC